LGEQFEDSPLTKGVNLFIVIGPRIADEFNLEA